MTEPTQQAMKFIAANKTSKIIAGAMLDKNKQDIQKPSDREYLRYTLANGGVFDLTFEDCHSIRDYKPNWDYGEI